MNKCMCTIITICTLWSVGGFAQTLNISKHRYIENQYIEVLWNVGERDGILVVQDPECSSCAARRYLFDDSLEVSVDGRKYGTSKMQDWSTFTGDVILTKDEEKLIAVKRYD